jgi:CRP/FNR family cyclic AMP-dependent transcriptional regulator
VDSESFARHALARCVLFEGIDGAVLDACVECLRPRRYRREETVFHQGDSGNGLYVIASGGVKVVLPSPDAGEAAILATLGPGDFFGELALLDGGAHSASVIALEPMEALVLGRADFERLLETQPGLQRALIGSLARELRRLTGHVEALHFLGLRERLAQRLAALAGVDATAEHQGEIRTEWTYTQVELAGMVGASRESVNRLLADFSGRGIVRFERDVLVIPDPRRLLEEGRS